jgi:predicted nucleic acid-binding Zn ribbon protein
VKSNKDDKAGITPIGDAIRSLLNSYQLESKFDEAQVIASWERLVGEPIARRTRKVFMKNKVLFVEFKTASMKNDFLLHKSKVIELFQQEFGKGIVTDIVII